MPDRAPSPGEISGTPGLLARVLSGAHPFLVVLAPIAALYARNAEEAGPWIVALLVLIGWGTTAMLLCLARLLLGGWTRAALLISVFNALFFSYGWMLERTKGQRWLGLSDGESQFAVSVFALTLLAGTAIWLRFNRRDLQPPGRFATTALCLLFVIMLAHGTLDGELTAANPFYDEQDQALRAKYRPVAHRTHDSADTPDVYYIILDGYARHDVLQNVHGYDNRPFLDYLRGKGFYVAEQSCSNYAYTFMSLPSSLNMRYFNDVISDPKAKLHRALVTDLIRKPLAARVLQAKGYRFLHYATNCALTEVSDYADETLTYNPRWLQSEFTQVLLRFTPLQHIEPNIAYLHLDAFEKMKQIPQVAGPTFTFVHMVCPHPPYVFDREGNVLSGDQDLRGEEWFHEARKRYIDQLVYLNRRMEEVLDRILKDSPVPPVILVQADHGTSTLAAVPKTVKMPEDGYDLLARERLPILNAYYVPQKMRERLRPDITPVNTFRLLFATCFGEPFEELEDRSYIGWYQSPYDVRDATQLVARLGPPTREEVQLADRTKFDKRKKAQLAKKQGNKSA